ncbi:hypothetical protein [Brevibacillus porteri]|uniref:hypothetical protein n=1 Tax=Brevibacillus porteri TaxID=2126350 RepID=UPI003D1AF6E4
MLGDEQLFHENPSGSELSTCSGSLGMRSNRVQRWLLASVLTGLAASLAFDRR